MWIWRGTRQVVEEPLIGADVVDLSLLVLKTASRELLASSVRRLTCSRGNVEGREHWGNRVLIAEVAGLYRCSEVAVS